MQRVLFALPLMLISSSLLAAGWGDLKVKFVYDGTPPKPAALQVTKDVAVCGKQKLVKEDLVVDPETKGVKNVVAYIYLRSSDPQPAIHSSYDELKGTEVLLDNKACRFEPHIASVWTEQKLVVKNSDPVGHNAKINTLTNVAQNPLIPAGKQIAISMSEAERLPSEVACNIHPWMQGFLVVRANPYIGVSNDEGEIVLKNMPAGDWKIQFWHEKPGYLREVKGDSWSKGRVEVTIKDGAVTDLGTVSLTAESFE